MTLGNNTLGNATLGSSSTQIESTTVQTDSAGAEAKTKTANITQTETSTTNIASAILETIQNDSVIYGTIESIATTTRAQAATTQINSRTLATKSTNPIIGRGRMRSSGSIPTSSTSKEALALTETTRTHSISSSVLPQNTESSLVSIQPSPSRIASHHAKARIVQYLDIHASSARTINNPETTTTRTTTESLTIAPNSDTTITADGARGISGPEHSRVQSTIGSATTNSISSNLTVTENTASRASILPSIATAPISSPLATTAVASQSPPAHSTSSGPSGTIATSQLNSAEVVTPLPPSGITAGNTQQLATEESLTTANADHSTVTSRPTVHSTTRTAVAPTAPGSIALIGTAPSLHPIVNTITEPEPAAVLLLAPAPKTHSTQILDTGVGRALTTSATRESAQSGTTISYTAHQRALTTSDAVNTVTSGTEESLASTPVSDSHSLAIVPRIVTTAVNSAHIKPGHSESAITAGTAHPTATQTSLVAGLIPTSTGTAGETRQSTTEEALFVGESIANEIIAGQISPTATENPVVVPTPTSANTDALTAGVRPTRTQSIAAIHSTTTTTAPASSTRMSSPSLVAISSAENTNHTATIAVDTTESLRLPSSAGTSETSTGSITPTTTRNTLSDTDHAYAIATPADTSILPIELPLVVPDVALSSGTHRNTVTGATHESLTTAPDSRSLSKGRATSLSGTTEDVATISPHQSLSSAHQVIILESAVNSGIAIVPAGSLNSSHGPTSVQPTEIATIRPPSQTAHSTASDSLHTTTTADYSAAPRSQSQTNTWDVSKLTSQSVLAQNSVAGSALSSDAPRISATIEDLLTPRAVHIDSESGVMLAYPTQEALVGTTDAATNTASGPASIRPVLIARGNVGIGRSTTTTGEHRITQIRYPVIEATAGTTHANAPSYGIGPTQIGTTSVAKSSAHTITEPVFFDGTIEELLASQPSSAETKTRPIDIQTTILPEPGIQSAQTATRAKPVDVSVIVFDTSAPVVINPAEVTWLPENQATVVWFRENPDSVDWDIENEMALHTTVAESRD